MPVSRTDFTIIDKSDINPVQSASVDTTDYPVYFIASSADKGPEEYKAQVKKDFAALYLPDGIASFSKHGQPLLTAAQSVVAGARVNFKRIVAEDAKLANIGVVAHVTKKPVPKTDENGNPIYTDGSKETTNPVGTQPVMIQKCQISFTLETVTADCGDSDKVMAAQFYSSFKHTNAIGDDGSYPLFIIMDNGRGVSNKKFRIVADTSQSRPVDYVKYILTVSENGTDLEHVAFTFNPLKIEDGSNISLDSVVKKYALQIRAHVFDSEIDALVKNVSYITNITEAEYQNSDILFGNNLFGKPYDSIIMGNTVTLNDAVGISLVGGSNGDFGDSPINATTYVSQLVKAFNAADDEDDTIYDLDNLRIDLVPDCNYPDQVKRAIEDLAEFREDFCYLRDMGTGITTMAQVKLANNLNLASRYCATYHNSWDIYDPYTKKEITVTAPYNLAIRFVNHFINGVSRAFCGQTYGITWTTDEVIEGTVNFAPKKTPSADQKQWFDDNRINYATYYSGLLTMESQYTSQVRYTKLSFLSNVMNLQSIIREVRQYCPKNRYRFLDGNDLTNYQKDVNNILEKHSANFAALKMVYAKDKNYENNQIYYAYIYVVFRNVCDAEKFLVYVLNSTASIPA